MPFDFPLPNYPCWYTNDFSTIPNVEIWFHIFQTFFYFLVFLPQAPVWSPMCPTSSINLVQWTLGCVGCPGYPHSRLIPQGNLRASRPWVTNDTSRREREREKWSPPIQKKEITLPKHKNTIVSSFRDESIWNRTRNNCTEINVCKKSLSNLRQSKSKCMSSPKRILMMSCDLPWHGLSCLVEGLTHLRSD